MFFFEISKNSKKNQNKFLILKILKIYFYFSAYGQILKVFHAIFIKKLHFYHVLKNKKNRYHN